MYRRPRTTLAALTLALALSLTGCAAPVAPPDVLPEAPHGSTGQNGSDPAKESMIDPGWPWPADVRRPAGVVYEFSAKNPLGEGGLWQVDFPVADLAGAQEFADSLAADGWEFLGDREGIVEDDSASWVLSRGGLMGTLSTENPKDSPIVMSFSLMGALE